MIFTQSYVWWKRMSWQTHPKNNHIKSASLVQLPSVDVDGVDHSERVRCTHHVADLKRTKLIYTIGGIGKTKKTNPNACSVVLVDSRQVSWPILRQRQNTKTKILRQRQNKETTTETNWVWPASRCPGRCWECGRTSRCGQGRLPRSTVKDPEF